MGTLNNKVLELEVHTLLADEPFKAELEYSSDVVVSSKPRMLHIYTKKTQLGIPLGNVLYYTITEVERDE